ncbi:hypothetical protein R9C00_23935 [Flammeovirgaceae bacterium SG7u.111]|nr:hypothetical protein [Flammeovirgaceae bacterium SG7u.132]WPO34753.1 hypothetical protein R9C00_23935 [Flammeovirgaceae bacterium SG7u.111]
MKNLILYIVVFTLPLVGFSQVSYEERIEHKLKEGYEDHRIFPLGKNGFVARTKASSRLENLREWKFDFYDTNLTQVKSKQIDIHHKYLAAETLVLGQHIHTLFKTKKGQFTVVSINISTMETFTVEGMVTKEAGINEMAVLGDFAYFKTRIKKHPYLFSINWKTGQQKPIPVSVYGIQPKKISFDNFQLLKSTNEIFLYASAEVEPKRTETFIIRLNDKGEKIDMYSLTDGLEESVVGISAFNIAKDQYIFTGTYTTNTRRASEGVFFCSTIGDEIGHIEFYKFLDLDNFLSYLPEKKQEKIARKKERKKQQGKELTYNYQLVNHDIIRQEDGFVMLGEVYYPTYVSQAVYSASGNTRYVQQFDGYYYTHAVIAKFGLDGKLLWDQTFELRPSYKPFTVKKFIALEEQNKQTLKLVFPNMNKIVSKVIGIDGTVLQEKESERIETVYEGDYAKRGRTYIDFWYDNYFLTYGEQKIKNKLDDKVPTARKVFFVSKVKFE